MLGYSSYLDKSMNGIKTLTDGVSIIQNGNASFNSVSTNNIDINNIADCNFVNCTTSTIPTIANSIVNKNYCDSNFCDLSTPQDITAIKTFKSRTLFHDIANPTDATYNDGIIYGQGTNLILNSKKNNILLAFPSNILFYVSPRHTKGDELALTIQGSQYSTSTPTETKIFVGGAFYSPNRNYLGIVNVVSVIITSINNSTSISTGALIIQNGGLGVGLDIWCGGNLTVIGLTTLSGNLNIIGTSTLTGNLNITGTSTLTGNLNITGSSIITGSLTIPTITTSNRLITSYIETLSNNQILYNMFDGATTTPTISAIGGYSTQYNNSTSGAGVISMISYGGGGTTDTGGFEFSYLNSIISKTLISTFYPTQITFYKSLTISGTTITNLSNLSNNPLSTDNSTNIATTAFVNAQGFLTSTTANSTYCNLSTNQTINGEKKFTNIFVESVINLSYTTVPNYPIHAIGYSIYVNGFTGHRTVPSGVIYDVIGGGLGIYCGTYLLEYCVTIKPDTIINIDWLMTGISTSATVFTNYSGFDNTNFKTTISLAQRTIQQQQTIHYTQTFVNTTGSMNLFLIGLCNINSGNAYYYNPGVSVLGPYPTPSCYLQATRIA